MNRDEFCEFMWDNFMIKRTVASQMFDALNAEFSQRLMNDGKVKLFRLGALTLKHNRGRDNQYQPLTGERFSYSGSTTARYSLSVPLKRLLNSK